MQKVFKHLHAMLCRDGFGVELHPLNIKLPVPDTHDFSVGTRCRHREAGWKRLRINDKRMIASHPGSLWDSREDSLICDSDRVGLSVHHLSGKHNLSAEHFPDRLVPEAHAENRELSGKVPDRLLRNPSV